MSGKGKGGGSLIWADEDAQALPPYSGHLQGPQSTAETGTTEVAEAAMEDGYRDLLTEEDDDIFGVQGPGGKGRADKAATAWGFCRGPDLYDSERDRRQHLPGTGGQPDAHSGDQQCASCAVL